MILITALILGICSAILELILIHKLPWLHKLCKKVPLVGLVFSFILSMFVGSVFGAVGIIVMIAGVISTVLTAPYYWIGGKWDTYKMKKQLRAEGKQEAMNEMNFWQCRHCNQYNKHSNDCNCTHCGAPMGSTFQGVN